MEYRELQSKLRETYPNTWIGMRYGLTTIATTDTGAFELLSLTKKLSPDYNGEILSANVKNFMTIKLGFKPTKNLEEKIKGLQPEELVLV